MNSKIQSEGIEQTLAEVYFHCTQLQYDPTDSCWDSLCQICSDKLIELFHFRKMCIDSYNSINVQVIHTNESETNDQKPIREFGNFEHEMNYSDDDMNSILSADCSIKIENVDIEYDPIHDTEIMENGNIDEQRSTDERKAEDDSSDSRDYEFEVSMKLKETRNLIWTKSSIYDNFDCFDIKEESTSPKTGSESDNGMRKPRSLDYACDICPEKFTKKARYDAHMRTHQDVEQLQCPHCENLYTKKSNLKAHITVKHPEKTEERPEYICDINGCGKKYTVKVGRDFLYYGALSNQSIHYPEPFLNTFQYFQYQFLSTWLLLEFFDF